MNYREQIIREVAKYLADYDPKAADLALEVIAAQPQEDAFTNASRPLIKHLAENHNPHATAIVTGTGANLLEGLQGTGQILDYIKD